MKKTILSVVAVATLFAASAKAQTTKDDGVLRNKKGEVYLPEAGDWAIGIDATPFLNYAGDFFGKTTSNSAPTFNFPNNNMVIQGKYFKTAQMAYRAGVRIGLGSNTNSNALNNLSDSTNTAQKTKVSNTNIALTAGLEWRKGKTRLQGYYGGELGIMYGGGSSTTNTYAIALSDASVTGSPSRVTSSKTGNTFGFGVRGFVGVEYFIIPKLSIGGEFGWGIMFSTTAKGSSTSESKSGTTVTSKTTDGAKGPSSFQLDTDNKNTLFGNAAVVRVVFHF
jgi:hypothetical protein